MMGNSCVQPKEKPSARRAAQRISLGLKRKTMGRKKKKIRERARERKREKTKHRRKLKRII